MDQSTWPDLWGAQSIPLEEIIKSIESANLSYIEKEHCITINLDTEGEISFSRPSHNTNAILSAQWISFVARLRIGDRFRTDFGSFRL